MRRSCQNDAAKLTRQLDILILNLDEVSIFTQPRLIEMGNGFPGLGEANEFLPVNADRVRENTTAIDHSNCLVVAEKNFIYGRTLSLYCEELSAGDTY
jgi:hypothetical protein